MMSLQFSRLNAHYHYSIFFDALTYGLRFGLTGFNANLLLESQTSTKAFVKAQRIMNHMSVLQMRMLFFKKTMNFMTYITPSQTYMNTKTCINQHFIFLVHYM